MVWGGSRLGAYKGLSGDIDHIGESWELSAFPDRMSVVSEGPLKGRTLESLVKEYRGKLVGRRVYRENWDEFPLLFKFIDAERDLSIQVHPGDELARRMHGTHGKTEMWYVIDAEPGAFLYSGIAQEITPDEYAARVADGSITEVLARYEVQPGDVFFLPAGRIHAIGAGCLIAEIQQTSDLTYRIFDYNRLGLDGKPRQLHTELARKAIDYRVQEDYRTHYTPCPDTEVELVRCPYFTTTLLDLTRSLVKDLSRLDSFLVVMCLSGSGSLEVDGARSTLRQGETVLIPAHATTAGFLPDAGGMKLLSSCVE
jgi:mannose-6-phosphate isomerase